MSQTTAAVAPVSDARPAGVALPVPTRGERFRAALLHRGRLLAGVYLLLVPTVVSMLVFGYYPKVDVVFKSLYDWTPGQTEDFIGMRNFIDAFNDPLFWQSFKVVMIMLIANIIKLWPGIIVAIALHRITSDKWRYLYQVLFVVPMVVPGMVWLLVWKSFYDPDFGLLNRFLNGTGLMAVLAWLDGTAEAPGVMPVVADALRPVLENFVGPAFGGVWALMLIGTVLMTLAGKRSHEGHRRFAGYGLILAGAVALPLLLPTALSGLIGLIVALTLLVVWCVGVAKLMGSDWIIWPFWLMFGWWAFIDQPWIATLVGNADLAAYDYSRLAVTLAVVIALGEAAHATMNRLAAQDLLKYTGLTLVLVASTLIGLGLIWTTPTGQFTAGTPAWLGNQDLVLPSLIFWGFPWVGTVGVLIYLAGLQQISQDVYEAAELDGVGPVGKLFYIELPLMMTQVRINLIFMTIGTLTGYEMFLILLGPAGGPGNVGMVPGLYMYKSAFLDSKYGYACALGMVLFVIILLLTIIYQKYVKVEK